MILFMREGILSRMHDKYMVLLVIRMIFIPLMWSKKDAQQR